MADTMIADMPTNTNPTRSKKGGRTRKALKPTNQSPDEPITLAGVVATPPEDSAAGKENHESLSQPKKTKSKKKPDLSSNFEKELEEMQEKLQQLRIEKEQTEEMVKARDEMLKQKDEEIKKLQKIKEFKPTMIKKANPEAEFKDISTILGTKWKTVTAEEKKPYEEKYQAEKEAYLKVVGNEKRENEAMKLLEEEQKQRTAMELLEQYLQFKQEAGKETKKKKKEKDPLKPKQPMSAFFVFANARRAALVAENKSVVEVAKITGEEWKNMTEKQKKPYEKIANKNKEKYAEEMEAYKQKKEEEAINLKKEDEEQMKIQKQEALQLLKKKEKAENIIKKTKENRQKKKQQKEEKNADPNKPKKPASSFILFSKETRKNLMEERPGINNSTLNALVSVKWKELSEQDKLIWNEKAAKAMEAYKKELEEYNKIAEVKENSKA
ncbi:hypothetical protein C3L33_08495, partial [Rhododendron williamsianum]